MTTRKDCRAHYCTKRRVPSIKTLEKWLNQGYCKTPCGCKTEPDGTCPHGKQSWMLILGLI